MIKTLKDLKTGDYLYGFGESGLKKYEITKVNETSSGTLYIYLLKSICFKVDKTLNNLNSTRYRDLFTTEEEAFEEFLKESKSRLKELKEEQEQLEKLIKKYETSKYCNN